MEAEVQRVMKTLLSTEFIYEGYEWDIYKCIKIFEH